MQLRFLIFSLFVSYSLATRYLLLAGAGGCDSDDTSCKEPSGTDTISIFHFDTTNGAFTYQSTVTGLEPNWLKLHPTLPVVYAVSGNGVAAFSVDVATAKLTMINSIMVPGVVFIDVDADAKFMYVAQYGPGKVSSASLMPNGGIGAMVQTVQFYGHGVNPVRQEAPHPHSINVDKKSGKFVYIPDLGLDIVFSFSVQNGRFVNTTYTNTTRIAPGSGPRHMAFHPSLPIIYLLSEMASTISVLPLDSTSGFISTPPLQIVPTLPSDFKGFSKAAEVVVHPSGNWLFSSNRGTQSPSNTINVFKITPSTGFLTQVGPLYPIDGTFPRGMVLIPMDNVLIAGGQDTNTVTTFSFDTTTGKLTVLSSLNTHVITPVTFAFLPVPAV